MAFLEGLDAVIFDLDDTLADWRRAEREAFGQTAQRHLVPLGFDAARAADAYAAIQEENKRTFAATGRWWLVRERLGILAQRLQADVDADALASTFLAAARTSLRPLDGAHASVAAARAAGLRVGLLTNGPSDVQRPKLAALRMETAFDEVAISGETGAWKPDARAFTLLLERLATAPTRAAMVGDHLHFDIGPARRLGMRTAWIDPAGAPHPDADVSATSPRALLAHFGPRVGA